MTHAERQRIVDGLNARFGTTLAVEVLDVAVATGLTTWPALQAELLLSLPAERPVPTAVEAGGAATSNRPDPPDLPRPGEPDEA